MPRVGGKKSKGKGSQANKLKNSELNCAGSAVGSDEESLDAASIISVSSSRVCDLDVGGEENDNHNDDGFYDDFEEKLLEAIDNTTDKNLKTRCLALEAIKKAFTMRFMYDFINERKATLTDILERNLKRGKGEEQGLSAILSSILCTTLGPGDETDMIFSDIKAHLAVTLVDPTAVVLNRSKYAVALGICYFITGVGSDNLEAITDTLQSVFSASYHKGNGVPPMHVPEVCALHSNALLSWTLLLTIQPPAIVKRLADKYLPRITELLDSSDVDLRIAAGEAIAVLYEISREYDEYFDVDDVETLCNKLRQLATDCQKFRAKKDRRIQRSSFRDVLKAVEERESPMITVKFGRERLVLDSWCKKRQYDAFCHVLGSGMNLHLTENDLLRDIFELGPAINASDVIVQKTSKFERHMNNLATSKLRTKCRSKLRDKRADVMNS